MPFPALALTRTTCLQLSNSPKTSTTTSPREPEKGRCRARGHARLGPVRSRARASHEVRSPEPSQIPKKTYRQRDICMKHANSNSAQDRARRRPIRTIVCVCMCPTTRIFNTCVCGLYRRASGNYVAVSPRTCIARPGFDPRDLASHRAPRAGQRSPFRARRGRGMLAGSSVWPRASCSPRLTAHRRSLGSATGDGCAPVRVLSLSA